MRPKFIIGGLVILAAVGYLVFSTTKAGAEYFMTVDELLARKDQVVDKKLRISGAVIGDTIQYDAENLVLTFDVAQVPGDQAEIDAAGGLAEVLHQAVSDPSRNRIKVVYQGVKPDLMKNEAQAIMTGHVGADGVFYADELLLKCPTRYESGVPDQTQ
jgi:cytochrome c-type biogenesis protein CcmE